MNKLKNIRRFSGLLALKLLPFIVFAQYTQLPIITAGAYNILDYGAKADGKTLNTEAIQKALDAAGKTGGKVIVPAGTFITGPLKVHSLTELEIAKGAVLRLMDDTVSFPAAQGRYLNMIDVGKAEDVKISGEGTLDGQGAAWWRAVELKSLKLRRPQMVYIEGTTRVEISGITFLNPPNTHLSLKGCNEVYIHDIKIQAPASSHNTDGINISAKNCTIERCTINTGDDNIAVNFGNRSATVTEPEVLNLLIRDCSFGYGHGLSIGSFTSGGLKNMLVSNCSFEGTTSAIRIKTARGRGGLLTDVRYQEITINNSRYPIFISEYYPKEPNNPEDDTTTGTVPFTPVYNNISLSNIKVTNAQEALIIWGIPESPIRHILFDNVQINATNGARIYNATDVQFIRSGINISRGDKLRIAGARVTGLN